MARLFPHDFDINETCALVESVAQVLSEGKCRTLYIRDHSLIFVTVPAKRFSEALYNMLASLRQRKNANNMVDAPHGSMTSELAVQEPSTSLIFTSDGLYSGEGVAEGLQIPDPLFPSWLTDLQFDGVSFLSGAGFTSHFG